MNYRMTPPKSDPYRQSTSPNKENRANTSTVKQPVKEVSGVKKVEKGLNSIHMKLMEFINKSYVLTNNEARMIHRDLTMKFIEINRLLDAVITMFKSCLFDDNSLTRTERQPAVYVEV